MKLRFIPSAILVIAVGAALWFGVFSVQRISMENPAVLSVVEPKPEEVRMVFVGDVMLSRSIGKLLAEKKDFTFPFTLTTEALRSADIAFANLESPISDRGVRSGSEYSFRAEPRAVEGLAFAGFDVLSVANNHIWDYGKGAFLDTLSILEENGIVPVGGGANYGEAHSPRIITVGKTRVAFLAYTNLLPASLGQTNSTPSVARYDDEALGADIIRSKELADVVVVSFHWGEEYQTKRTAEQERAAKLAIDSGASLVIGHHPHVMQEVEEYNGGYIAYSLGNFVFDQNFSEDTKRGLVLLVTLKDGKIAEVAKREVAFTDDYQPYFVERVFAE